MHEPMTPMAAWQEWDPLAKKTLAPDGLELTSEAPGTEQWQGSRTRRSPAMKTADDMLAAKIKSHVPRTKGPSNMLPGINPNGGNTPLASNPGAIACRGVSPIGVI